MTWTSKAGASILDAGIVTRKNPVYFFFDGAKLFVRRGDARNRLHVNASCSVDLHRLTQEAALLFDALLKKLGSRIFTVENVAVLSALQADIGCVSFDLIHEPLERFEDNFSVVAVIAKKKSVEQSRRL